MSHVILGVSASIALHRALDVTSELRKAGHDVSVVMTPSAKRMIAPVTFQALSLRKVFHEMWEVADSFDHDHIRLAQQADVLLVAPATASTVGKLATGILDNVLLTTAYSFQGPCLVAPAMNWRMWSHPVVQANVERLESLGWELIPPAEGDLACGERGPGRLAAVPDILERLRPHLSAPPSS